MSTTSNHPRSSMAVAARELRAHAEEVRERSRRMLAEDRMRRERMRARRLPAELGVRAARPRAPVTASGPPTQSAGLAVVTDRRPGVSPADPTFHWLHGADPRSPEPPGQHLEVHSALVAPSHVMVRAVGEVDVRTAPVLVRVLSGHLTGATRGSLVTADLAAVGFLDAAGLRALHEAAASARERGAVLRIVNCSSPVLRVLDLTGSREALIVA